MKNTKRFFALMLCMMLCLSLCVCAFAAQEQESEEELPPAWSFSEDKNTLFGSDRIYHYYPISPFDWFRPYHLYTYSGSVDYSTDPDELPDYYMDSIGHPATLADDPEADPILNMDVAIVYEYVSMHGNYRVYVTDQGKQALSQYTAGNYARYELTYGYSSGAEFSEQAVRGWNAGVPDVKLDVTELAECDYYYVLGYDSTLTFAHVIGAVFDLDGAYYYVHYDALDNNYFDAEGDLSFRSGSVPAIRLGASDKALVDATLEQFEPYSADLITEPFEPLDATISMIVFVVLASPLLFVLPLILLVLGIVMRSIKKIPNRKRWNAVILCSCIWLIGSVLTSVLLIIPTIFL